MIGHVEAAAAFGRPTRPMHDDLQPIRPHGTLVESRLATSADSDRPGPHAPRHYGFVDALRGIAFLQVFFLHISFGASYGGPADLPCALSDILGRGYAGVQLFFVVSAFTLCASFESRGSDRTAIGAFFVRRVFRIVPMFWTAILLYWVMQGIGPFWLTAGKMGIKQYALAIFLLHGFDVHGLNGVVPGGWSVAVECQFYVLLPLLYRAASSLRRAILLLVAAILVSIVAQPLMLALIAPHFTGESEAVHQFVFFSLPAQLPVFCCGILAWRLLGPDRDRLARVERLTRLSPRARAVLAGGVVLAIGLPFNPFVWPPTMIRSFPGAIGYGFVFALLVYATATWPLALIDNRATRYIGKVSYSAYLTQFIVLTIIGRVFLLWVAIPPVGQCIFQAAFGLAVTLGLSTVSYAWIEGPGMALGRRVIAQLRARGSRTREGSPASASR